MTSTPGPAWLTALRSSGSVGSSVSFWIDRYAVFPSGARSTKAPQLMSCNSWSHSVAS
jgi:hypothetical protein